MSNAQVIFNYTLQITDWEISQFIVIFTCEIQLELT